MNLNMLVSQKQHIVSNSERHLDSDSIDSADATAGISTSKATISCAFCRDTYIQQLIEAFVLSSICTKSHSWVTCASVWLQYLPCFYLA